MTAASIIKMDKTESTPVIENNCDRNVSTDNKPDKQYEYIDVCETLSLLFCPDRVPYIKKYSKEEKTINLPYLVLFLSIAAFITYISSIKLSQDLDVKDIYEKGFTLIGIFIGATFFVTTLVYTLDIHKEDSIKLKRDVVSQATLFTICQILLSFGSFLYILFYPDNSNILLVQVFNLVFIVCSDIKIFFDIFALYIFYNHN